MRAVLFGAPGSGRKTLMQALCEGVPVTAGKKTVTTIRVGDDRVPHLSGIFSPKKTTWSNIEISFEDRHHEIGSKLLQDIKGYDVLVPVFGAFEGDPDEIPGQVLTAVDSLLGELILADHMVAERRLASFRKTGEKGVGRDLFERVVQGLDDGERLGDIEMDAGQRELLAQFNFLTFKTVIAVVNVAEEEPTDGRWSTLRADLTKLGVQPVILSAALESEIATLAPEEQAEFLAEMDMTAPASHRLVQSIYSALDLISFFTVGEDEVRAWGVHRDAKAPEAGAKIHTDIQRGFIRAEVVAYDDFIEAGSLQKARSKGTLRLEGKDYVVQDGDIINFRFNV
jgi:ribosome-binding ATPase YchF (GTP1/OBG family)